MAKVTGNTIGSLARGAGLNIETIRYCQRRCLLGVPSKAVGGCRQYSSEDIDRLRFIKRAQKPGFSLNEVGNLLQLGQASCAETRALATLKLILIEDRIADLERIPSTIRQLVQRCDTEALGGLPNSRKPQSGRGGRRQCCASPSLTNAREVS